MEVNTVKEKTVKKVFVRFSAIGYGSGEWEFNVDDNFQAILLAGSRMTAKGINPLMVTELEVVKA